MDLMGRLGGHTNPSSRLASHRCLANHQFRVALNDLDDRRQGRHVSDQSRSGRKSKQDNFRVGIIADHQALFARVRWRELLQQLSDLVIVGGHGWLVGCG